MNTRGDTIVWVEGDRIHVVGDASLIAEHRTTIKAIQSRAVELDRQGKSADETAQTVQAEFHAKYPEWTAPARMGLIARTAYMEER